jgi:CheY-like chemotaxis protein
VLDLAKVEAGKMEFRPETVNLAALVAEVRDVVRGLAANKRLRLTTQVDPEVTTAVIDSARVKQILYNYLSNAIKFTDEGGNVDVRIGPDGPSHFRIDVIDTGIGIAPGQIDKLFVEFQQLDAGAAKKYQGSGLGLALTKRLAEAHGGRVVVQSAPGRGSTFSVILPRALPAALDADTAKPPGAWSTGRTILVVDDDGAALKLADVALRELGCQVIGTADPEAALNDAAATPPAAVILDLLMPALDGFEFVARLRAISSCRHVPVVIWTVKDIDADDRRRLQGAAVAILSKSAGGPRELVEQIRGLLAHDPLTTGGRGGV